MRMLLLVLLGLSWGAPAPAATETRGATPTTQVLGLEIRQDDVLLTDKTAYVHMLWDAFPARAAITRQAAQQRSKPKALRDEAARALAASLVPARFPKAVTVKVDVVEFPERDAYGQPEWGSVSRLGRFEMTLSPTGKAAEAPLSKPTPKKKAAP